MTRLRKTGVEISEKRQDAGKDLNGNAMPWVWRSSFGAISDLVFPSSVLEGEAADVARALLGSRIRSVVGGPLVEGIVVETEAYVGPHDPASHAAERIGLTHRNRTMFGPAGLAYVYRSYGVHWCLNVVTGTEGYPAAVLIRGLDPIRGLETVNERRGGRGPLCAGPGRLSQALGISGDQDCHCLTDRPLELLQGWDVPNEMVGVSSRVGIRLAAQWPLRFYIRGHPQVSRGPKEHVP